MNDIIAAFLIVNITDPSDVHRVEIAPERRSGDNWWARKVESGLVQRVDWERFYIAEEYTEARSEPRG